MRRMGRKFALLVLGLSLVSGLSFAAEQKWADLNVQLIKMYQDKLYTKAIPVAQTARDAADTEYGAGSRESILATNNLAMLYKKTKKYSAAAPLYKQALAASEKRYGMDSPDLALPLNNLAMLYDQQKNYVKADEYSERAIAILEKAYGPDHALTRQAKERYEAIKKARLS